MTSNYHLHIQAAQKTIFERLEPTVEHFCTDVFDSTRSVKGRNVNQQAQVPSFRDALKIFRFIYPS